MRSYPTDKWDLKELESLKAEQWQLDLLKLNPPYTSWGVYEDNMTDGIGWSKSVITSTWKEHHWGLDDLNELVNFYFSISRKSHQCPHCEGSGQNEATHQLAEDWYDFAHTGRRWCDKITDVEVLALAKRGRLHNFVENNFHFDEEKDKWVQWVKGGNIELDEMPQLPTADEINAKENGRGFGHDAINRIICVEARAKHLGIYGNCPHCEGEGVIYDAETAHVSLQLWYIHPRKGASRGVLIEEVEKEDIPNAIAYLKEAAQRNADRFSKL